MDAETGRALAALAEVMGRVMIGLAEDGQLPRQYLEQTANQAALRLEPVAQDTLLATLQEQWLITARYLRDAG